MGDSFYKVFVNFSLSENNKNQTPSLTDQSQMSTCLPSNCLEMKAADSSI